MRLPEDIPGYTIVRVVGQGGFGVVVEARSRSLGRTVALKILSARPEVDFQAIERFEREVQLLMALRHDGLIPVLDADLAHDPPYLVVPWMAGGDLMHRLRARGPAPAREVLELGVRLAGALGALHQEGILHRDVKPANVLLDEEGKAWLADLGLGRSEAMETLTVTGMLMGTPRYMAPELVDRGIVGPGTDVYALGVSLLEVATGAPAAEAGALGPESRRALDRLQPAALRKAVAALLAEKPSERPGDGHAAQAVLEAALAALGEEAAAGQGDRPGGPSGPADRTVTVVDPQAGDARASGRMELPVTPLGPRSRPASSRLGAALLVGLGIGVAATRLAGPGVDPGLELRALVATLASGPPSAPPPGEPPWLPLVPVAGAGLGVRVGEAIVPVGAGSGETLRGVLAAGRDRVLVLAAGPEELRIEGRSAPAGRLVFRQVVRASPGGTVEVGAVAVPRELAEEGAAVLLATTVHRPGVAPLSRIQGWDREGRELAPSEVADPAAARPSHEVDLEAGFVVSPGLPRVAP